MCIQSSDRDKFTIKQQELYSINCFALETHGDMIPGMETGMILQLYGIPWQMPKSKLVMSTIQMMEISGWMSMIMSNTMKVSTLDTSLIAITITIWKFSVQHLEQLIPINSL